MIDFDKTVEEYRDVLTDKEIKWFHALYTVNFQKASNTMNNRQLVSYMNGVTGTNNAYCSSCSSRHEQQINSFILLAMRNLEGSDLLPSLSNLKGAMNNAYMIRSIKTSHDKLLVNKVSSLSREYNKLRVRGKAKEAADVLHNLNVLKDYRKAFISLFEEDGTFITSLSNRKANIVTAVEEEDNEEAVKAPLKDFEHGRSTNAKLSNERLSELMAEGLNGKKIADETGLSSSYIYRRIRNLKKSKKNGQEK